jgi:hypothetical protein
MIAHMSKNMRWVEGVWLAGCYVAVYNVPTGYRIWEAFPWDRVVNERESLGKFIAYNWRGFSFRRERRAVRSIPKLTKHLNSYADWVLNVAPVFFEHNQNKINAENKYVLLCPSGHQASRRRFPKRTVI